MESIFSKIYPYKQKENKSNLENYLIEIFAFCLQNDDCFRNKYLAELDLIDTDYAEIDTQIVYDGFGRPDIEIKLPSATIIIECKVESTERQNQLNNYISILKTKSVKRKILVYLTKYYETKDYQQNHIEFVNTKWHDIYHLISDDCNSITKQLKTFLKEKEIAMDKNFNSIDLVSLENISSAISKMDEVLDSISDDFSKIFGQFSKASSRSTKLKEGAYYNYREIGKPYKFIINIGFMWWDEDNLIYLATELWIPFKENEKDKNKIINFFSANLGDWENEENDHHVIIGNYKSLHKFISNEKEQIPAMIAFLKDGIDKLAALKNTNPKIFK